MKFQQVYAVVDESYRLLWVGGEWDEFALQNGSQGALANKVLSTSLMGQVIGEETRVLTARMIDTVLASKRPLRLVYRCDSPSMARKFLLTIQPMKDHRALMVHDLQDAWHYAPPLNLWRHDPRAPDCKCSFCGNVRFEGSSDWTPCDIIGERHPTHVTYEVCVPCREEIEAAIALTLNGAPDLVEGDTPLQGRLPPLRDDGAGT